MDSTNRPLDGPRPFLKAPPGTIDTHMHIIAPEFPTSPLSPPPFMAPLDDYAIVQRRLGIERAILVQPNAYQLDNSCLEHALTEMGDKARAVAAIMPETPERELERLHKLGVRGARIMDIGPGAVSSEHLLAVAGKISPLGWHPIIQFNGQNIADYAPLLTRVKGPYVIDHAAKFMPPVTVDDPEFVTLLHLIDRGNCYVKLSACYETSEFGSPDYEDVSVLSKTLAAHAPERMLWASNWPHVSARPDAYPDDARLLDILLDWVSIEADRRLILQDNAARLYDMPVVNN